MKARWIPHDTRDEIVDFIEYWAIRSERSINSLIKKLSIHSPRFYDWKRRYGKVNAHNGKIPRDFWLQEWERQAIIRFHTENPLNGVRRLAFMMIDRDIVAVSPKTVYNVLKPTGVLDRKPQGGSSSKGQGFTQPKANHEHWHTDVSYINISGTFYYLCAVLDGYSRYVVHWEIRESMKEIDIEQIIQVARERYPDAKPRLISDNGPQFISGDFKKYVKLAGMDHVRTSPYYPQSNGKIERWHKELKATCIRPKSPRTLVEAREAVSDFVHSYNYERLHSAIGYITPADKLAGNEEAIFQIRDKRLEDARLKRRKDAQIGMISGGGNIDLGNDMVV